MNEVEIIQLSAAEKQSAAWLKIMRYIDSRIAIERARLESTSTSPEETNSARGAIRAYRGLLALDTQDIPTHE